MISIGQSIDYGRETLNVKGCNPCTENKHKQAETRDNNKMRDPDQDGEDVDVVGAGEAQSEVN